MTNYVLKMEPCHINFSRVGFRLAARDCLSCFESYNPERFSLVKYFLVGRSIELALKALHLDVEKVDVIKKQLGHSLMKSYGKLETPHKILSESELELLSKTSDLYDTKIKAFEYIQPIHAAGAFTEFPDLDRLHELAVKLVTHVENFQIANP